MTMKQMFTLLYTALICGVAFQGYAQNFNVKQATIQHEGAERPCLQVSVDPNPDLVKEKWRDYIKDKYNVKLKGIGFLADKDLMSAEEVTIPAISDKQMDFYTQVVKQEGSSVMSVFMRFGYDMYVNKEKYPDAYERTESIMNNFLDAFLKNYYQEAISDISKELEDLNDEKSDLNEDNAKLQEDIRDNEEEIEKLKNETVENKNKIESNQKRLTQIDQKLNENNEKLSQFREKFTKINQ